MPAPPRDPPADTQRDGALSALRAALSVVFVSAAEVAAACSALRAWDWDRTEDIARLRTIAAPALSRTGPFVQPVVDLLRDAAARSRSPWPLLEALLGSRLDRVCAGAIEHALQLAECGTLRVDLDLARALAALADREASPLAARPLLERVSELLTRLGGRGAAARDTFERLLLTGETASLRRLAARLLDLSAPVPDRHLVDRAFGEADAPAMAPLLTYTRATHLDLVALVPRPGVRAPMAACLESAQASGGQALTADIAGEVGWGRCNLGLAMRRWIGVSVDDSLPLVLTPSEAALTEPLPGARRVFERVVATAHGGTWETRPDNAGAASEAIARFRAYNLAHAEILGDILDLAPLTAAKVGSLLDRMDHIVSEFSGLFASRSDECAALPGLYEALKQRILAELAAASHGAPLSMELTRLVQMFEDPASLAQVCTLHGLKRYLHQRGLALGFGLLESGHGTNRSVDLAVASTDRVLTVARRIEYVDFEPPADAHAGGAPVPYAVAIVADAFARHLLLGQESLPRVRGFCYGNEVHYFVSFKNHPVFIRIDFSPPLGGGMIDLAYYGVSKFELHAHPAIALEAIQTFFRRLDFFVEVDTTRIHARYDKERALDLADLCEKAEALFRLVPHLMDVDWIVGSLDLPEDARRAAGVAWADLFARWGVLPVQRLLTSDRTGVLAARERRAEGEVEVRWQGAGPYVDTLSDRPRASLIVELHASLAANGIDVPLVEGARQVGQIPLETHLLLPLRRAVESGELSAGPEGLRRAPLELFERVHEARRFAEVLAAGPEAIRAAARLARLAAALERSLRFEVTGSVNGYDVLRARLALRGESVMLFALRDASGIFRLAMCEPGQGLCRRRASVGDPWQDNASLDVSALAGVLRRNNFLPSWIGAAPAAEAPETHEILATFSVPNPAAAAQPPSLGRRVTCLRASPGRAVGLARLGVEGRRPEDFDGGVLVAATLRPEDQAMLHHAVAVVGTGGGILSHAGLMAVQSGRPALVLTAAWRDTPGGARALVYRSQDVEQRRQRVAGHEVVERRSVREHDEQVLEGDLVVVDANEGLLEVLGQDRLALALHDGLHNLDVASRQLARGATGADVLVHRGRLLRATHQVERLVPQLRDPVLIRHAVVQLITPDAPGPPECAHERARLLHLLRDAPSTGPATVDCLAWAGGVLCRRYERECGQAQRLIPGAPTPDDVLALRLRVLTRRDEIRQMERLLSASHGPSAHHEEDVPVDRLAAERLARMLADRMARLRRQRPDAGSSPEMRHWLREVSRLMEVVPASTDDVDLLGRLRRTLVEADAARLTLLATRRVLRSSDGGLELEPLAGAKAANLAELARLGAGASVPAWFVVTDHAFREALAAPAPRQPATPWTQGDPPRSLADAIDRVLARTDADAAGKAAAIRQLWDDVHLPADLSAEVVAAYQALGDGDQFVAIRSSAREEDTETAVRAGEFDTFLFVKGASALLAHLRRAWSGLWTTRAIHERERAGRASFGQGGGVLVQRIVWSRASGVLQTTNVAEGRTREMVVNVGLGLGEGVVSGLVATDHIVVSKDEDPDTEPVRFHYVTGDKRERVVFDERRGTGTIRADVLSHQRLRPALEYAELVELMRIATRLERAYGHPLDIEFGLEGADLWVLQVRPVPGARAAWRDALERHPLGRDAATSADRGESEAAR